MDSFIIANHLADLLKNYPAILETFLASKPDNYGIEEPKESGYYFKVSIITNEAERTDSSFCLVHVSSPFLANPCSQIMEVSSSSSGLQRYVSRYAIARVVGQVTFKVGKKYFLTFSCDTTEIDL